MGYGVLVMVLIWMISIIVLFWLLMDDDLVLHSVENKDRQIWLWLPFGLALFKNLILFI